MQLWIEKCATIKLEQCTLKNTEGTVLSNAHVIQDVNNGDYKHLWVLEANKIRGR